MLTQINGDITKIKSDNLKIICHQCNCVGSMGAGLALTLKKEFPKCYDDYMEAYITSKLKLGNVIISDIKKNNTIILHICGQYHYKGKKPLTNYNALTTAFNEIKEYLNILKTKNIEYNIYFPYKFGCGLAGGNWNTVYTLIEQILPETVIVKFN